MELVMKKTHTVHHSGGSDQFTVYTSLSLLKLVTSKMKDGHQAVVVIGNRVTDVIFDEALGAYVTASFRLQNLKPRSLLSATVTAA
jgi:endoglucanase Acf2